MTRQIVTVPEMALFEQRSTAPVSLVVKSSGMIFVSGIPPIDPLTGGFVLGSVEAQTRRVMDNIALCLRAAGAGFADVVRATVYATDAAHFAAINAVYGTCFGDAPPARTFAVVGPWPAPFDVEIECTAMVSDAA